MSKNKSNLTVAWRGVYFAPSAENIKCQVREIAKMESLKRIQHYNTMKMYEIFGSGKSKENIVKAKMKQKLAKQLSDNLSDDIDVVVDNENIEDFSKSRSSLKVGAGKSESVKIELVSKRKTSLLSVNKSVDIRLCPPKQASPVNYLNDIFKQNKPQHYFGIRKQKVFETAEEKVLKDNSRKMSIPTDLLLNIMNTHTLEPNVKETSKPVSGEIIKSSFQLSSSTAEELRRKISDINISLDNTGENDEITLDDLSEIINKLRKESLNDRLRLLSICKFREIDFPDQNDKMSRSRILELYVSKYYRIKHPLRQENAKSVEETPLEAEIMKNCVLNNKVLNKLLVKRSFFSHHLQMNLANIDASLVTTEDKSATKSNYQSVYKRSRRTRTNLRKSLRSENILDEICQDIKEFNTFYLPLLEYSFENISVFSELESELSVEKVKKYIQSLSYTLAIHRNHPGSTARFLTRKFIKAGDRNPMILTELINNVEGWLDQILKTFLSKFSSIRMEAFVTLAYLFSRPNYVAAIQSHIFHDIMYDVMSTILRCFDLKSEDYEMYYSLLGVIFHYAPSQVLLDCLMERAPYSNHIEVVSKWPRFLYLALRYWSSNSFNTNVIHLRRIIEVLETHYLRESLSRKYLKTAITCISKRFNINSDMFTTSCLDGTYYPD